MAGIGVLTNPRSRRNRRTGQRLQQLAESLPSVAFCANAGTPELLHDAVRRCRDEGVTVVAINGGDGSTHWALPVLDAVYGDEPLPILAMLRGGTMNTVSRSFGISGSSESLLRKLSNQISRGQRLTTVARRWISVQTGDRIQGGVIFGCGLIPHFLEVYYEHPDPSPWVGATTLARVATSALVRGTLAAKVTRPQSIGVAVDGTTLPDARYTAVLASTTRTIGLGFAPFYRAEEDLDRFHLLTLERAPQDLVPSLPWFRAGVRPPNSPFDEHLPHRCRLEPREGPLLYTLDGDLYETSEAMDLGLSRLLEVALPGA